LDLASPAETAWLSGAAPPPPKPKSRARVCTTIYTERLLFLVSFCLYPSLVSVSPAWSGRFLPLCRQSRTTHASHRAGFQDEVLTANHERFLERQKRKEEERRAETVRTEWCYGPQKLNYVELKKASASQAASERPRPVPAVSRTRE